MEALAITFGVIALIFLIWNAVIAVKISRTLVLHGHDVSYPLLHIRIYRYANLYKEITEKEDGKVGPLYGAFNLSNKLFFLFLILGIIAAYMQ